MFKINKSNPNEIISVIGILREMCDGKLFSISKKDFTPLIHDLSISNKEEMVRVIRKQVRTFGANDYSYTSLQSYVFKPMFIHTSKNYPINYLSGSTLNEIRIAAFPYYKE